MIHVGKNKQACACVLMLSVTFMLLKINSDPFLLVASTIIVNDL